MTNLTNENISGRLFIIMGRSGCGKGTQVELLIKHLNEKENKFKTLHVESGSLIRSFSKESGYTQKRTKSVMEQGFLIPEAIIVSLWTNYLVKNYTGTENLVFDGTPRKLREAQLLNDAIEFYGIKKPTLIYIDVSNKWAEERLYGRARKDDNKDAIKKRLSWFETDVMPAINYFKENHNYDFVNINGEQTIEDVHTEIMKKVFNV